MSVYKAINKVQAALAKQGISKANRNAAQGYNFRGIDDVLNALSPLLSEFGLCVLPRCVERTCVERLSDKGKALFYVTVKCEFDFVSAEDGTSHTVATYGEAMDSGDKATNKAMSAAYKYAAIQAFAIPTEGDNDADAHTHELAPQPDLSAILNSISAAPSIDILRAHFDAAVSMLPESHHAAIKRAAAARKAQLTEQTQ
jgi:hypothetical protein